MLRDELLCEGRRVKLYRRVVSAGDAEVEKDYVAFGESVVVVPVLEGGALVFVRQWRPAINRWIVELPAGRVELGEGVLEAAGRELEEETGFKAGALREVGSFYVSPGYSDELIHVVVAERLVAAKAHPEPGEVLSVVVMRPEEYLSRVGRESLDLKTVAAIHLYLGGSR
ncbi:NUDIX hydrolase [Thermofilum pendens]